MESAARAATISSALSPGAGQASGICSRSPLASRQGRPREPARLHRRRGQSVVRHRTRQRSRSGHGRRLVWRARRGAAPGRSTMEQDWQHRVRVTGGYTPFDFAYHLAPGRPLETPTFYGGYSAGHRRCVAPAASPRDGHDGPARAASALRPVLYNSWEATGFNVDEAGQEALAEKAASLGVERFVMDDGWFGERKERPCRAGRLVCQSAKVSARA